MASQSKAKRPLSNRDISQSIFFHFHASGGSRIIPTGVAQLPNWDYFANFFDENCMKLKESGPPGGRSSLTHPLDPPIYAVFRKQLAKNRFTLPLGFAPPHPPSGKSWTLHWYKIHSQEAPSLNCYCISSASSPVSCLVPTGTKKKTSGRKSCASRSTICVMVHPTVTMGAMKRWKRARSMTR